MFHVTVALFALLPKLEDTAPRNTSLLRLVGQEVKVVSRHVDLASKMTNSFTIAACELARNLGITKVLIHKHSSVLSAFGMALSNRAHEVQEPCAMEYNDENRRTILSRVEKLSAKVKAELQQQGFPDNLIEIEPYLNMR